MGYWNGGGSDKLCRNSESDHRRRWRAILRVAPCSPLFLASLTDVGAVQDRLRCVTCRGASRHIAMRWSISMRDQHSTVLCAPLISFFLTPVLIERIGRSTWKSNSGSNLRWETQQQIYFDVIAARLDIVLLDAVERRLLVCANKQGRPSGERSSSPKRFAAAPVSHQKRRQRNTTNVVKHERKCSKINETG